MNEFVRRHCRCPDCHNRGLVLKADRIRCEKCTGTFPVVDGRPVLIRHDNEVFPPQLYSNATAKTEGVQRSLLTILSKMVPSPSVNLSRRESLEAFANALANFDIAYVLVVGSGQQKHRLDKVFSNHERIELVYSDVDPQSRVDLFCDAHEIPFEDQSFHGVIVTAVLEHVLYPERVVNEIHRVLVYGGLLYSEIPLIQQVHAGAFDFTRYTLSGHRRLLNHFDELSSGLVAGPGTAMVWAIEHFALCFARSSASRLLTKAFIRGAFFWLKYFDHLFKNKPQALDGASCTYFLGKKAHQAKASDKAIVDRYVGADHPPHLSTLLG